MQKFTYFVLLVVLSVCTATAAENESSENDTSEYEQCLLDALSKADDTTSVAELKAACKKAEPEKPEPVPFKKLTIDTTETTTEDEAFFNEKRSEGVISKRVKKERQSQFDPYVITPHKKNYLLPISVTDNVNRDIYRGVNDWADNLSDTETKLQISFKVPLNEHDLFVENDGLFFGFTMKSWWQVYADDISKPFRETNYQPEIFYSTPLNLSVGDTNSAFMIGLEHQSNGRTQPLSRSWNRLYVNWLFEYENLAVSFKPWYRIPENDKDSIFDSDGDDNPDIDDYMGYFELGVAYQWDEYELHMIGQHNFSTQRGGAQIGVTFPLWGKLRGYAQYYGGYGESLIDYNHSQQRFGIGFALTDLL